MIVTMSECCLADGIAIGTVRTAPACCAAHHRQAGPGVTPDIARTASGSSASSTSGMACVLHERVVSLQRVRHLGSEEAWRRFKSTAVVFKCERA